MDPPGTLEFLAREVGAIFSRIELRITNGEIVTLFAELGVQFPPELRDLPAVVAGIDSIVGEARTLVLATDQLRSALAAGDGPGSTAAGLAVLNSVRKILVDVDEVAAGINHAATTLPGVDPETVRAFAEALPSRITDLLVIDYLESRVPSAVDVLEFFGVVERTPQAAVPNDPTRPPYVRRAIRFDRLAALLTRPTHLLELEYGWGTSAFSVQVMFERLERLLARSELPALLLPPENGEPVRLDLTVAALTPAPTDPPGLQVELRFPLDGTITPIAVPLQPGWTLETVLDVAAEVGLRVVVTPPAKFTASPPAGVFQGRIEARLGGTSGPNRSFVLLGATGGSRLEVGKVALTVGATFTWNPQTNSASIEPFGRAELEHLRALLDLTEADSFVSSLVGRQVDSTTNAALTWDLPGGLRFDGSSTVELDLPANRQLGPVRISGLHFGARLTGSEIALEASAVLDARLGPVSTSVSRIGLVTRLTVAGRGNLGPVNFDFGFKPPDGVGLSVDAGAVTGGGFLFFDPVREQYAGALHLEVEGGLALSAFGLLTTRMPDGSPGFSLLILVQASGFAPVPLGFGFTLTGVGGLVGINRTVDVEVLRAGLRNRTLDAILFSRDDPTPRAPQIVSTLGSVFPPAPDQYVFGPMVQIAWGPPPSPLLNVEVALVLELPAPLRLVVLGRVSATLPTPAHPIVRLRLDVVGVVDFDRRRLAVDATLYDSFVGPFALSGDMAARASWGETPDFAVALGGFHPAFRPPEGFPALRRLALTLSSGDNPRLRMEAYLALTSNTVQLGARLEFYVAAAGFSLEGGFGFDTLITLSPFRLQAQIDAGLTLKRGSTTLAHLGVHVNLVGPAPWEVWGTASISILFLDIKVPFHATFGEPAAVPEPERVDVWALLKAQLAHPANWATALPAADNRLATLVALPGQGDALVHPLGAVSVTQRLVPLERTLTLFGPAPPAEANFFEIAGAAALAQGDDVYDYFAPAQFRRMSDAEKLSSPSFDRMVSGAAFGPPLDAVTIGTVARAPLDYETALIVDLDDPTRHRADPHRPSGEAVATLAERGPAAVAELRDQGRERFAPPAPGPALAEPQYVVATHDTLRAEADAHDGTYSGAVEALRRRPDAERYQIVRREEAELAAL